MLKVLINNGDGLGPVDYTHYVVPASISVEDSINTPTLTSFTIANADAAFKVPVRSAYVQLLSTLSPLSVSGNLLSSGYITNEIQRKFLGLNARAGLAYKYQLYEFDVKVTSDEYLLNTKAVPFISLYINRTMGEILTSLADILAPGFFDTTNIQDGDLVPVFQYDPSMKWSDVAKQFADQAQFRYKVIGKKIYFTPYGDMPLGISYDETVMTQKQFVPGALNTGVLSVPLVNDCIVVGEVEPQQMWDDYFVGDGFSANFPLRYSMFHGETDLILQDDWTEDTRNTTLWNFRDPFGQFILAGALNCVALGGASGALGTSYIIGNNGLELGGHLVLQHGEIQFNDQGIGIVGGIYQNTSNLNLANCLAGFDISNASVVAPTASGANGLIMQPIVSGAKVGPKVTSVQNHHYILQTYITARRWARYNQIYRTLAGTPFGDEFLPAAAELTFTITDIDLAQAYNIATLNNPYVPAYIPQITRYTVQGINLPSFGAYVILNSQSLNLTLNYTMAWQPPTALLQVAALTGARPTNVLALTGGQLPVFDPNDILAMQDTQPIGPLIHYPMGFGLNYDITATIGKKGDADQLEFFSDRIPGVGARIRHVAWQAGHAVSRVQDPVSIAREAAIVGDDGLRSAIITDMKPTPRTSDECDLAAAAVIKDREMTQWDGDYTVEGSAFGLDGYFWDNTGDFPRSGRFFNVTAPQRGISAQQFLARSITTTVLEAFQEVYQFQVSYGQDLYLEKLLRRFVDIPQNVLEPTDTANPPDPQNLPAPQVGFTTYLDNLKDAQIIELNGTKLLIDLGSVPVTGVEVRRSDNGWASGSIRNLVTIATTQQFFLPRSAIDQTFYMRMVNGSQTSRFSRVMRVNYPMVPLPPSSVSVDFSVPLAPVVTAALPTLFDRNIYGVVIFGPGPASFCSTLTFSSSDPNDHRTLLVQGTTCTPDCSCETDSQQPQSEFIILNGTTPVTTTLLYGSFTSITPYDGLFLSDDLNASSLHDAFSYFLGPNGNSPLYRILNDAIWSSLFFVSPRMTDSINYLLAGANISLSITDNLNNWQDSMAVNILNPATLQSDSINFWNDALEMALTNSGGGALAFFLIIHEKNDPGIRDGVAHIGQQSNLAARDANSNNWLDNLTKVLT